MSIDPEHLAIGFGAAKVAGDVAKKLVIEPAAAELQGPVREFVRAHVLPLARRVLGLEEAAALAAEATSAKLAGVPPERLVPPDPAVASGTIEALQTRHDVPELHELFTTLLARAMDGTTADATHPAFVEVLRQLSADDARVFHAIALNAPYWYLLPTAEGRPSKTQVEAQLLAAWKSLGCDADVADPIRVAYAVANLDRVGLIRRDVRTAVFYDGDTVPIEGAVVLTDFGRRFGLACLPCPLPFSPRPTKAPADPSTVAAAPDVMHGSREG